MEIQKCSLFLPAHWLGTDHLTWRGRGDYGFLFRSEFFFFGQHESYNIFFVAQSPIFFPEFNIRLYDKHSESDFFFPLTKSEYFFQQHWESEYFFRKKTLQVKWSFPYGPLLIYLITYLKKSPLKTISKYYRIYINLFRRMSKKVLI